jgi:hypothetical protein
MPGSSELQASIRDAGEVTARLFLYLMHVISFLLISSHAASKAPKHAFTTCSSCSASKQACSRRKIVAPLSKVIQNNCQVFPSGTFHTHGSTELVAFVCPIVLISCDHDAGTWFLPPRLQA